MTHKFPFEVVVGVEGVARLKSLDPKLEKSLRVVTGDEAENVSVVICSRWHGDVIPEGGRAALCGRCGAGIIISLKSPTTPPKICIVCAAKDF